MKKHLQFLLLIAAFLMPGLAKAQLTATVADGTSTNGYVPVYGYYADAYLRAQIVYPESMLAELTGGEISQMTFHSSSSSISWGSANFEVKLGAATSSTLGSNWDAATLTTVYTGSLSISASGEMTVTFSTPYVYTGGDLLVEVNETTYGDYVSCTWLGVSQSGASIQGYDYDDWSSIYPSAQNFIPKTTFTYTPGNISCPFPINVVAEDITPYDATIRWSDTTNNSAWIVYYYPTDTPEDIDSVTVTDTAYYLTGLRQDRNYTVKVGAVCDTSNSVLRTITFTTPLSCYPVMNLACGATTPTGAIITWSLDPSDSDAQVLIEYKVDTVEDWTVAEMVSGSAYAFANLTENTNYNCRVSSLCSNGDTGNFRYVDFTTAGFICAEMDSTSLILDTIGGGSSTSSYFPAYSFYCNGLTQQIYREEDFSDSTISGINIFDKVINRC